ncbi:lysine N(6)-hydroxylase/L-ornithine N(5)-oxygenase family protein [Streptomyces abyssomicinicus]|uniref:lysine N(6)-hydroxylase/L-ornithine N(5)-oxygenase family protein n=1 Tax=Streptomyces abyssomicinicus TaxID=574929 RepID=UPI00124F8FB4|nr:SidA/IucD/PvdA family monooxygenase [Streptomyces abyssomicinicus]
MTHPAPDDTAPELSTPLEQGGSPPRDLVGIGVGPANLSLAALAQPLSQLDTAFYERRPAFDWHPGLLIDGTTLQVPFLADLVTLVDPASRWTFLNYLRARDRLFPFYLAERFHIHRAEYDAYCRWVSENLPGLHFRHQVDTIRWNARRALFEVEHTRLAPDGTPRSRHRTPARHIALGIGTEPHVPAPLEPLAGDPHAPVIHSADYLHHRERLLKARHLTLIGTGQSGAEVFLDLLRHRPPGREDIHWLGRTPAFAPMEYSKLGLEHFTPDYTRYFHGLAEPVRDRLVAGQWQLHKGIDADTITAIHDELYRRTLDGGWPAAVLTPGVHVHTAHHAPDGPPRGRIRLGLEHVEQGTRTTLETDAVVLATGYRQRPLDHLLTGLAPHIRRDHAGRPQVDDHYRLRLDAAITGDVYVQNAELHTHGVGAPDLGLVAWRSATILNTLTGKEIHRLPDRTAFTTFGLR